MTVLAPCFWIPSHASAVDTKPIAWWSLDGADKPTQTELAREILGDTTLNDVHRMAKDLLKKGFNAGSGYGEVWIRDLNTA